MSKVKLIATSFKVLTKDWGVNRVSIFDVLVREDEAEVTEDASELFEEDGPEEEIADEPVVSAPKKKRQKWAVQVAASGSSSTTFLHIAWGNIAQ